LLALCFKYMDFKSYTPIKISKPAAAVLDSETIMIDIDLE